MMKIYTTIKNLLLPLTIKLENPQGVINEFALPEFPGSIGISAGTHFQNLVPFTRPQSSLAV